jgi:hypothetical protein
LSILIYRIVNTSPTKIYILNKKKHSLGDQNDQGFYRWFAVANGYEWFAHKYLLHGVHRKGKPRFSPTPKQMESHWAHHREVRKTFLMIVMSKVWTTGVRVMS